MRCARQLMIIPGVDLFPTRAQTTTGKQWHQPPPRLALLRNSPWTISPTTSRPSPPVGLQPICHRHFKFSNLGLQASLIDLQSKPAEEMRCTELAGKRYVPSHGGKPTWRCRNGCSMCLEGAEPRPLHLLWIEDANDSHTQGLEGYPPMIYINATTKEGWLKTFALLPHYDDEGCDPKRLRALTPAHCVADSIFAIND
ncbi:uncharacterized protein BT62DRAFT_1008296 [Guyanagaster necrorhizus]|uniref:Uncharacterized protein n=1 Tax=Guyanagaster necrorhizus TaxID=856835 RepID=A0A9P8AQK8_9AGAR|nr:uncharacterized protein BT62DRAFT_1008296 [Guyanagaster necrorhizus MCA 3950]KAG7444095.1 hypothetical protein BT62DRAFT_1008296 [Guyanagaster necrorhizus MCA 3950]